MKFLGVTLDLQSKVISNAANQVSNQDAATKAYVDTRQNNTSQLLYAQVFS